MNKESYVKPTISIIQLEQRMILTESSNCYWGAENEGTHAYVGCIEESGHASAGWVDDNRGL